jgi:hypothetical protein
MREFKLIGKSSLDEYENVYNSGGGALEVLNTERPGFHRNRTMETMDNEYDTHFIGLYDGDEMIAAMKIVDFCMNIYGHMQQATGLMSIYIHAAHYSRELVVEMVKHYEKFAAESGSEIALIFPQMKGMSKQLGYGAGNRMKEYMLATADLPTADDISKLHFLGSEDIWETLKYHENFARHNHGVLMKCIEEIRDMQYDTDQRRIGYVENSHIRGYLSYMISAGGDEYCSEPHIFVDEMVYENRKILRCLLGFLKIYADNATIIVLKSDEENFEDILGSKVSYDVADYMSREFKGQVMGKILAPDKFVRLTDYRRFPLSSLRLRINYKDELEDIERSVAVEFVENLEDGCSRWKLGDKRKKADVSLTCGKAELASLLLRTGRLSSMVRTGSVTISDMGYVDILDHLFYATNDDVDARLLIG